MTSTTVSRPRRLLLVATAGVALFAGAGTLAAGLVWQQSAHDRLAQEQAAVAAARDERDEAATSLSQAQERVRAAERALSEARAGASTTVGAAEEMLDLSTTKRDLDEEMATLQQDTFTAFLRGDIDESNALGGEFNDTADRSNEVIDRMWEVSEQLSEVDRPPGLNA